jgi:hypothetical protein
VGRCRVCCFVPFLHVLPFSFAHLRYFMSQLFDPICDWYRHKDRPHIDLVWDDMLAEAKARGIMIWRSGKRVV